MPVQPLLSGSFLRLSFLTAATCTLAALQSPGQAPPVNGMRPADLRAHAIVGATVIPSPGETLENASIIIRDGVIEAVGVDLAIPPEARVWPGEGLTVYPGLIEPALMIRPANDATSAGAHWNPKITPERNMAEQPGPDQALRSSLRSLGFTAAAVYSDSGVLRGSGVVIALADEDQHMLAYRRDVAQAASFEYGGRWESAAYPGSLMGAIALLRQTLHDARWHAACRRIWQEHPQGNEPPKRNDALLALSDVIEGRQPVLFDVSDELNALRAARLAREFNLNMMLLASGFEFRRLADVVATKLPLIVPLEFPRRPDVSTLSAAENVSLRDLMTWEQAPTNPRRLLNAGATVALTTHRLRSRNEFHENLRNAIKHGLTEDQALAALTTTPAKLLGVDHLIGTIEPGKLANLVVVKGSLFEKDAKIHDTWINGRRYEIHSDPAIQIKGSGTLTTTRGDQLEVELDTAKSSLSVKDAQDKKLSAKKVVVQQDQVSFLLDGRPLGVEGYVRFSGVMEGTPPKSVTGTGALPSGETFGFTIEIADEAPADASEDQAAPRDNAAETPDTPATPNSTASEPKGDVVTGEWALTFDQAPDMAVTMQLTLVNETTVNGTANVMGQNIEFTGGTFDPAGGKLAISINSPQGGLVTIEATITGGSISGTATSPAFTSAFVGTREGAAEAQASSRGGRGGKKETPFIPPPEDLPSPFSEYGLYEPPQQQDALIHNATIWTCGPEGRISNGWMLVRNGKIAQIGHGAAPPEVIPSGANHGDSLLVIDAEGRHVTPGLIDCHSHTGIDGGVNEWTQANTAECRIGDCIDPDDINWYRQLAGGLTAANQLHGSANPIGGQNSVVKLKWGAPGGAEAFRIPDAIAGIKFALGENVKRSQGRYPNTRMGVETFIRDAFTAARDYKKQWDRYLALPQSERARTMPPRRDLELDALVEILEGRRLVHCHSYRQDEILMLIRVADSFGFTIGTFQHVLEGYKVAEAIAKHGAGGSSFSDWWAYKIEVMDAIPFNGALMHDIGVLVSFNSDSNELARRMNYEAAKAVRYGGMAPEEALKFVTINPAKQLRIDHRTGSLEVGKDADFVIWSGDPLSAYTRCEQTWIEGARYFDLESDRKLRDIVQRERQRIIQKILVQAHGELEKKGNAKPDEPRRPNPESAEERDSSTAQPPTRLLARMMQQHQAWIEEQIRVGRDPDEIRPGECGCNDAWAWFMRQ